MSVKVEYICNTCGDIKPKEVIFAVIFSSSIKGFNLWSWNTQAFMDHKGVHVCQNCLENYRKF